MTMNSQNNELEQMRRQLAILTRKLDSQEIVSDRLMREAMKNRMSWIRRWIWAEVALAPVLAVFFFSVAAFFHLSVGPAILMAVMLAVSVVCDYRINIIDDRQFLEGNLAETAVRLARMKKRRLLHELAAVPFMVVWLVWYGYDLLRHIPSEGVWHDALTGGFVGLVVGCVVGAVVAVVLVRRMQRTNDELIRQIRELGGE